MNFWNSYTLNYGYIFKGVGGGGLPQNQQRQQYMYLISIL